MPRVAEISFRSGGRLYQFDVGSLDLSPGDMVVARTVRGVELGVVRTAPRDAAPDEVNSDLKPIERRATPEDIRRGDDAAAREREAMAAAVRKIAEHRLPMKLIAAESTLDGQKIVFHFSAENRVDFRGLVRDLAQTLRTRIELHQVGVRDEAKLRGGMGPCGRPLCCATFLSDFDPVGIKMAKEQDLSLNPQKISGTCGRLMCCLNFEYAHYKEAKQCLPRVGARIETEKGPGKIQDINVLRNRVIVSLEEGGLLELPTAAVAVHKAGCPHLRGMQQTLDKLAGEDTETAKESDPEKES
jgi:cell fate regulator YaaT (PSP1 superfamily)